MFPVNLVIRVSFVLLTSKVTELLWQNLFSVWMAHGKYHLSDGNLFVRNSLWIVLTERLHAITKLVFYNHFYWTIYKKGSKIRISPKIILIAKKRPLKVTSTTFLLREIEKLGIISCYLISLYEKTSHGMTAFWQWTSKPVNTFARNLYKVQSLCHHSTQHSGSLYQLIWLLL